MKNVGSRTCKLSRLAGVRSEATGARWRNPERSRRTWENVAAELISRILSAGLLRQDGHSSGPRIAAWLKRPTRRFDAPSRHVLRRTRGPSLFGLAPCGVCPARCITAAAVRSYRTFSPLPVTRRYVFCGTFRRVNLDPPSRTLSGTLLCGVRTFLLAAGRSESDRPVQLPTLHYIRC